MPRASTRRTAGKAKTSPISKGAVSKDASPTKSRSQPASKDNSPKSKRSSPVRAAKLAKQGTQAASTDHVEQHASNIGTPGKKRSRNIRSESPVDGSNSPSEHKMNGQPFVSPPRMKRAKSTVAFTIPFPFKKEGEVFVVGSGDCGQLGLGPDVFEKEKVALLQDLKDKHIVHVVAGGLHNIAIDASGKLYSWGCNDQKALGRDGEETVPARVEGLDDKVVVDVACGDSITAALTSDGQVYTWGTFRSSNGIFGFYPGILIQDRPFLMKELPKHIVQIDAGANHLVALSKEGKMFTWGVGEQGQLGHRVLSRRTKEGSLVPRAINFYPRGISAPGRRAKRTFNRIYCGGYSTYLVHDTERVYAYGLNNYGQLGVGPTEGEVADPMLIDSLDHTNGVQQIVGGEHHTLLLDKKGHVFAFGRGDSGQLGVGGTPERFDTPQQIAGLENITSVSANGSFSLAISATSAAGSNEFYTWGYGDMGQLANSGGGDEEVPFEVPLKGREIISASAGGQHSVLLLQPKKLQ
ncbi:regulator of chromosome condensation 1/beta-lactamase-inhibitor protein II [Phlyctochytrium arcticum]|nr:regulator of chromosome condensation 1/beta-lactamase-inhibitor protein II [Phlyctochytrium arcticum]